MHVLIMKSRSVFKLYQQALVRRPYLIQAVQTGTLMGAGDLISQTLIEKKELKHVDYMRTIKFSSIGFFVGVSSSLSLSIRKLNLALYFIWYVMHLCSIYFALVGTNLSNLCVSFSIDFRS